MRVPTSRPRRIVIADNDPEVLELLVTDLRAEGHEIVATTTDGGEAIELCRRHHPDVLIVDFRMPPGPNGVEVSVQVAAECPGVGIVLFSNYRLAPDARRRAQDVGARVLGKGNIRALRRAVEAA